MLLLMKGCTKVLKPVKLIGIFILTTITLFFVVACSSPTDSEEPIRITASSSTSLTIQWNQVESADYYQILHNSIIIHQTDPSSSELSHTVLNLQADTQYTYLVRSCTADNICTDIGQIVGKTEPLSVVITPDIPSGLQVDMQTGSLLRLSWTAVSGAVYYHIYKREVGETDYTRITSASEVTGTSYTDTAISLSTSYNYAVSACIDESSCSTLSDAISATINLDIPAGFRAQVLSSNSIVLSWNSVSGAAYYRIDRQDPGGVSYTQIAFVNEVTGTSYTDEGLSPATTYRYRVSSCISAPNCSEFSNAITATTESPPPSIPDIPRILNVDRPTTSSLFISWEEIGDAITYSLNTYRGGVKENSVLSISAPTANHNRTGLSANTEYSFSLQSCNISNVCSDESSQYPGITNPLTPANPSGLMSEGLTGSSISLSWSEDPNYTTYYLVYNITSAPDELIGNISSPATQFIVNDLEPQTSYTFRIHACNRLYQCSAGADFIATTLSAISHTQSPTITPLSPFSLNISWEAQQPNALYYQVFGILSSDSLFERVDPPKTYIVAEDLSSNREYTYTVRRCITDTSCISFPTTKAKTLEAQGRTCQVILSTLKGPAHKWIYRKVTDSANPGEWIDGDSSQVQVDSFDLPCTESYNFVSVVYSDTPNNRLCASITRIFLNREIIEASLIGTLFQSQFCPAPYPSFQ